ncbi:uncharacterized protein LOC141590725 [Silene latifolia]|uniref:uncharacterized protein LOC141590725 n=1 Tax=Silene latifolia TaxID=37657 RepID=UPI003D78AD35
MGRGGGARWRDDILSPRVQGYENIRVSANRPSDEWYWVAEKDGLYSVRLAYRRLAGNKEALEMGGTSDWEKEKWLWNRLWKVPVWPRVKLFFCIHLFCDCPLARRAWEGLGLDEEGERRGGVRDWMEVRWKEFGCREQALFMIGCWALWEHRNKVIFESMEADPSRVIRRATKVLDEIEGGGVEMVRRRDGDGRRGEQLERRGWGAPQEGIMKVNVDAGVKRVLE